MNGSMIHDCRHYLSTSFHIYLYFVCNKQTKFSINEKLERRGMLMKEYKGSHILGDI